MRLFNHTRSSSPISGSHLSLGTNATPQNTVRRAAQGAGITNMGSNTKVNGYPLDTVAQDPALHDPHDPTQLSEPLLLGRYRVMASNTTGGFGCVLTCWDTRLQRRVAIKRMPLMTTGFVDQSAATLEEALAEARTSSLLAHPNIVSVYDFEVDANFAYLVMEYVDGLTLGELLSRVEEGTLTSAECSYLAHSVIQALEFAHENGVLHLDIKPSNIMINHAGVVKICDFGMATLASATGYEGARGGTVGYMPPEQIVGDYVDERSDIFSLAVVLWQALCGVNPFVASTAERSLEKIEKGPAVSLARLAPDLDPGLEDVLLKAMSAAPAMRYHAAQDFYQALAPHLGNASEGRTSIKELLAQDEEYQEETGGWSASDLSVPYRYPWLATVIDKGSALICLGIILLKTMPYLAAYNTYAAWIYAGLALAVSAIAPPFASVFATIGTTAACLVVSSVPAAITQAAATQAVTSTSSPAHSTFFVLFSLMWLIWWFVFGRHSNLSSFATLLGAATGIPWAGSFVSSYDTRPVRAALEALLSWCLTLILSALMSQDFYTEAALAMLAQYAHSSQTWMLAALTALAAVTGSLVTRTKNSTLSCVFGQIVTFAILIGALLLTQRLSPDSIWTTPLWFHIGLALVFCVMMCVVIAMRGPQLAEDETEETYELT